MTGLSQLLGAIALIGLGGLFAAIDAAISTMSLARVQELVRDERPGARALAKVMADRPRYINLVVLLRITCEITATVLLVVFLYDNFGLKWGLFGAAAIMVLTSFVVIGVGPRTLGRQHAYSIALATALPLQVISWLLMPIRRLLVVVGNAITPGRGLRNGPFASEIELREVVDLAQQRGVVAADERKMIESVFELGDTPAREVMVPRTEMIWIEERQVGRSSDQPGRAQRAFPHSGDRRERRRHRRRRVPERPCPADVLVGRRRPEHQGGAGDAPGGVRAGLQAARLRCCVKCSATATTWRYSSTSTAR